MSLKPAIFFDRDDTLIKNVPYSGDPSKVQLLDGAHELVWSLKNAGFDLFIATNQSGVGRGLITKAQVADVNNEVLRQLGHSETSPLFRHIYCGYAAPGDTLDWEMRKPNPGMLLQAASDYPIDLSASFMVGDKLSDVLAGKRAGCRTILTPINPESTSTQEALPHTDFCAHHLSEIAPWIQKNREKKKAPSVHAIIPARYASTRFPKKMLASLVGKPLLQWVWEGVKESHLISRISIATDHPEIATLAESFQAEVIMTDPDLPSGTDRVAQACTHSPEADIIVNVQGDEPLITGKAIDALLRGIGSAPMATLARRIDNPDHLKDPNIVKVVSDLSGKALYFSRHTIPFIRDTSDIPHYQHLGIYAYRKETLHKLISLPPSPLEQAEKLEQLRALQNGIAIKVVETSLVSLGVDRPEDLNAVESYLKSKTAV